MKTALISSVTASLLAVASFASGRSFGPVEFVVVLFTTGLVAWTVSQYSSVTRPLSAERPVQFPTKKAISARAHRTTEALPLAA